MEWLDPFDDVPSWREMGASVEAELTTGAIVFGTIEEYDMTPGPDEEPLFKLRTENAELSWFDDIKRFRFVAPNDADHRPRNRTKSGEATSYGYARDKHSQAGREAWKKRKGEAHVPQH